MIEVHEPDARETTKQADGEQRQPSTPRGRTMPEKITTAISILLIGVLAGLILYEGYASGEDDPAQLTVTVLSDQVEQRGEAYYVPVEVFNEGDEMIEEALVSIEVSDGERVITEAETVIATLAEAERVTAMLVLEEEPSGLTIEASVVTFQVAEE